MKKLFLSILALCLLNTGIIAQSHEQYVDEYLAKSFEAFHLVDFDMAWHILPFLRTRFEEELSDTSSFHNPFDSLSNFIGIKTTPDQRVKTYSWTERSGGCCHTSATFAQFRTLNGTIQWVDLEALFPSDEEIFIVDLFQLETDDKPYYLMLGWGTCCGGKHYEVARVFEITSDYLSKLSPFNEAMEIYAGANRGQEIKLEYDPEKQVLSYFEYDFNGDIGFYKDSRKGVQWKWTGAVFEKTE